MSPVRSFLSALSILCVRLLSADGQTGGADRIQVMFTPTICQVRCSQGRCLNSCERGNLTTLYSAGEAAAGRRDGAQSPSFRVFVCPLLCQNGGVCLQTDRCLCPPTFTGKFCHIPVTMTPATPPSTNDIASHSEFLMPLGSHPEGASAGAPSPSMVKVRVQHPPEASVKIHQVLKQRSEFKYCFREVKDGQVRTRDTFRVQTRSLHPPEGAGLLTPLERSRCGWKLVWFHRDGASVLGDGPGCSPLPGLRSKDMCCRGIGKAWGITSCVLCPQNTGKSTGQNNNSCPAGFQRTNQTHWLCDNGLCVNTRGSYSCVCRAGFILDASHGICAVISEEKGQCFRVLGSGLGPASCSLPILRNITKQICCCSRVGKAWGAACLRCPYFGSAAFKELCPAGPGYQYSASAQQFNQRVSEQLGAPRRPAELGHPKPGPQTPPASPQGNRPPCCWFSWTFWVLKQVVFCREPVPARSGPWPSHRSCVSGSCDRFRRLCGVRCCVGRTSSPKTRRCLKLFLLYPRNLDWARSRPQSEVRQVLSVSRVNGWKCGPAGYHGYRRQGYPLTFATCFCREEETLVRDVVGGRSAGPPPLPHRWVHTLPEDLEQDQDQHLDLLLALDLEQRAPAVERLPGPDVMDVMVGFLLTDVQAVLHLIQMWDQNQTSWTFTLSVWILVLLQLHASVTISLALRICRQ
uniref:EGF-like domain-containing protein n=1 Tax=Tetraodon nigroviridis TaxID=99883 RepID=H3D0T4_TETNG